MAELRSESPAGARRQHHHPVLVALPAAYDDLRAAEIEVAHAQPAALAQPQARAVERRKGNKYIWEKRE